MKINKINVMKKCQWLLAEKSVIIMDNTVKQLNICYQINSECKFLECNGIYSNFVINYQLGQHLKTMLFSILIPLLF